jgi:basic membrane protein A and related proteins
MLDSNIVPDPVTESTWGGILSALGNCGQAGATWVPAGEDPGPTITQLVAAKEGLILTADLTLAPGIASAAPSFPAVRFATIDAPTSGSAPNLIAAQFREDQAGYLAGALAGLMTKTNVVGGVYGLEIPTIRRYRLGFESGVRAVNPIIARDPVNRLLGVDQPASSSPFSDPAWGRQQAHTMIDQGADVIFSAGGSTASGALLATAAAGRMCIGTDFDMYGSDPRTDSCLLTSAVKDIRLAARTLVTDAARGTWPSGGTLTFDLSNGGVGLAPYHAFDTRVPASVRTRLRDIQARLKDGSLSSGA